MNIFFCDVFKTYTANDTVAALQHMGHTVFRHVYVTPPDIHKDGKTTRAIIRDMEKEKPDVVMTINFWGVVADACKERNVTYIAWIYDSPMEIRDTAPMRYGTNRIFLFDRTACEGYWRDGFSNVFYMPLAAEVKKKERLTEWRRPLDITLVGRLYASVLPELLSGMDDYERGYLDSVFRAQQQVYGGFIIPELLTEDVISKINGTYERRFLQRHMTGVGHLQKEGAVEGKRDGKPDNRDDEAKKRNWKPGGESRDILSTGAEERLSDRLQEKKDVNSPRPFQITAAELSFAIATELTHRDRLMLLALLSTRFETNLFTYEVDEGDRKILSRVAIHPAVDYETKMPGVFAASKINLNPILRANGNGIPLRALDVLGAGGFLLSTWREDFLNYFVPDEEIVLYTSIEEAVEKASFYMEHDDLRNRIAEAGRERIRKDFTYDARLKEMLKTI